MSLQPIAADQALQQLQRFDSIIDARSEAEFAEDHLPGALNWPSLNNEERKRIGTLYQQTSPFAARKQGAALVAANIARHIERELGDTPRTWQPLIYCWRGGKRSSALALVLDQIGFRVEVLEGGYKAYRSALLADLPEVVARLDLRVICGPTGSGKTRLLQALARRGAQTLDLEDLANHRSSVLGLIPGQPQPSQKRFDSLVWRRLQQFDAARPVFVESESKKVGNVAIPDSLMTSMRDSPCLSLQWSDAERVELLLEDYDFFVRDPNLFCERLDALSAVRGKSVVERWKSEVRAGRFREVVQDLLLRHYDPGYDSSTRRNFRQFGQAMAFTIRSRSEDAMLDAADQILRGADGSAPVASAGTVAGPDLGR